MTERTIVQISKEQQGGMLKELRRGRYGYLLALHILLLCAAGYSPTIIAAVLFCSRSSIYRIVGLYREGKLGIEFDEEGIPKQPVRTTYLMPNIKRSILALLKQPPKLYGWCRVRWSCATLGLELKARRGIEASAETMRRWLHECGWEWKRAKLRARDDDPERDVRLARIRSVYENLSLKAAMFFADELDIDLLAKVGYQWMQKGTQLEVMTPGRNEKNYLAGALNILTGTIYHCISTSKNTALFLDLLKSIDSQCTLYTHIYIVVDNYKPHKAKAVQKWLAEHPRFELLYLPSYCPRANPIERAFGDVHDMCTRNHKRTLLADLVQDVKDHLRFNGPWLYKLSRIYFDPVISQLVQDLKYNKVSLAAA